MMGTIGIMDEVENFEKPNVLNHEGIVVAVHREDQRGNVYTLLEELTAWYENRRVRVPIGFESDGCSVPRWLWAIVFSPGDPNALRAGICHDYIYRTHPYGWTKTAADRMFYGFMILDGVSPRRARRAYLGVRFFGWFAWWKGGKKNDEI